MKKVKIVIIDSGVDTNHENFASLDIKGSSAYLNENGQIEFSNDITDSYGHGTAIFDIINKNTKNSEIYNIKIFDDNGNAGQEEITKLLEYIYYNIPCDIINLSLGITQYADVKELEKIINKLYENGTIIISAFSNDGSISYPAAFVNVIGVESNKNIRLKDEIEFVENSIVTLLGKGGRQRVLWKMPEKYAIVEGNSFTAAYITAYVANILSEEKVDSLNVLNVLKRNAKIIHKNKVEKSRLTNFKMPQKAVAFPFNKEIHSLVRYHNNLAFEMEIYDIKFSGRVGKSTGEFIENSDFIIKNINELDWTSNFDTFILGHIVEISTVSSHDFITDIINKCIVHRKNLYAFDNLDEYEVLDKFRDKGLSIYYPSLGFEDVPNNSFGKLYFIPHPTLAICGTSSQQGKFTLQLLLRNMLINDGYKVGQLGTEPSSLLYGMDKICSIGYGYNMSLSEYPFISAVNKMVYDISQKDPDIILCGNQSGTIPYSYDNLSTIPLHSMEFLMAVQPDAVIICVNYHDDVKYIARTIKTIENLLNTHIIGVVLFPMTIEYNWQGILFGNKRKIQEKEIGEFKTLVKNITNKEVYLLGKQEDMLLLKDKVINYFSEE